MYPMDEEATRSSHQLNMLEGGIFGKMCRVALPIALMSTLQQLFNATDMAVAGRFASSNAMAAVGSNAPVINIVVMLFTGLSIGSNVLIAGLVGAGKKERVNEAMHTGFAVALISGFIMLMVGTLIAKPILGLLDTPASIMPLAVSYLRLYFLGMPFLMIYDFGNAVLRAVGDTKRPLFCLMFSGLVNVVLNLILVIGFQMSSDGTAIATTIANAVSATLIYRLLVKETGMLHFEWRRLTLNRTYLKRIIAIGGPAGLQGMIFSVSNIVIQAAINHFGAACVAGNSAGLNFEYISYFFVNGFAQATVTFISQNYAAHQYQRCRKIARIAMISAVLFTAVVSMTFYVFRYPLVDDIFSTNQAVVHYAIIRITFIALLEPLTATYEIAGGSLRGIDHSLAPAIITLVGCCILRVVYIAVMLPHFTNFTQVALIYPVTWIVTGTAVICLYESVTRKEYVPDAKEEPIAVDRLQLASHH